MVKNKAIKIFLGSSIVEFESQRNEIDTFIGFVNEALADSCPHTFEIVRCEKLSMQMDGETQKKINEGIKQCDFAYFIIGTDVGQYTQLEINVANENFKEKENPVIFTFLTDIEECKKGEGRKEVEDLLFNSGHYFNTFKSIDELKWHMLLYVFKREFLKVGLTGSNIYIGKNKAIDIHNIPRFSKDGRLKILNRELKELNENKSEENASAIEEKEEEIKYTQNMILEQSFDSAADDHDERLKKANKLYEEDKIDEALEILSLDILEKDLEEEIAEIDRRAEAEKQNARERYIRRNKVAVNISNSKTTTSNSKIKKRYDHCVDFVLKNNIPIDILYDYAIHLLKSKNGNKCLKIITTLYEAYLKDPNCTRVEEYKILKCIADVYYFEKIKYKLAKEYYQKALDACKGANEEELKDKYELYILIGDLYRKTYEKDRYVMYQKAIDFVKEHLEIIEFTGRIPCEKAYERLAQEYYYFNEIQKAEETYKDLISFTESLDNISKETIIETYEKLAEFYQKIKKDDEAEKIYINSIALSKSADIIDKYIIQEAYDKLAQFYKSRKRIEDARKTYEEAIQFAKQSLPDVGKYIIYTSYSKIAELCRNFNLQENFEDYETKKEEKLPMIFRWDKKSLEEAKRENKKDDLESRYKSLLLSFDLYPKIAASEGAYVFRELAELYEEKESFSQAKKTYENGIKVIKNRKILEPEDVLLLYDGMIGFYIRRDKKEEAENLCTEALEYAKSSDNVDEYIIKFYQYFLFIYDESGLSQKAEDICLEYLNFTKEKVISFENKWIFYKYLISKYISCKKIDEALILTDRTYDLLKEYSQVTGVYILDLFNSLANFYKELGDTLSAEKIKDEIEARKEQLDSAQDNESE